MKKKLLILIKEKAKSNKKEITKDEAEKILKQAQNQDKDKPIKSDEKVSKQKVEAKKTEVKKSPSKSTKTKSVKKKQKKLAKSNLKLYK